MAFNRIWPSLILMGLTLGSMAAVAQQPVKTFLPMPPDFNDERYRSPGIAYVERLWALPDCQLQTAAESGQLFWACVISNPHPGPHDGWMWIGEISPAGQLLHSGYLSGGDEDSQSLGKGKILAISQNILILAEDKAVLAYQLSYDTQTQPLKPIWRIEAGFEIAAATIGSNQEILVWGYDKDKSNNQIEKLHIKIFHQQGSEIWADVETRDSWAGEIIDRQFFSSSYQQIKVIGKDRIYIHQHVGLPEDCYLLPELGQDPNFFSECSAENIFSQCDTSSEQACVQPSAEVINKDYTWTDEEEQYFFSCIYTELGTQADTDNHDIIPVQAVIENNSGISAFSVVGNLDNPSKHVLQVFNLQNCETLPVPITVNLPEDLLDVSIRQVKRLPDGTLLIAYMGSKAGSEYSSQLMVLRLDLQKQKILWNKIVISANQKDSQYLELQEDWEKLQIEIAYDEKAGQIGVAVFNNSINPNNWDDFPRPLDDQEFFPRIYTFRLDQ